MSRTLTGLAGIGCVVALYAVMSHSAEAYGVDSEPSWNMPAPTSSLADDIIVTPAPLEAVAPDPLPAAPPSSNEWAGDNPELPWLEAPLPEDWSSPGGPVNPASIMAALSTACVMEDDLNCYWRADLRGNGIGTSFVNVEGHIFPLTSVLEGS